MTFGFALLIGGVVFLLSGVKNKDIANVLKDALGGKESTEETGGPGQGFTTMLASLASGAATAASPGASEPGIPVEGVNNSAAPDIKNVPRRKALVLAKIIARATSIIGKPYSWGGGHSGLCQAGGEGENGGPGYDCSGAVCCALGAGGLIDTTMTSGGLMSYGSPGPGKWITIYANPVHTFMKIGGVWFGTGSAAEATRGGPAWGNHDPDLGAYTVRHPPGF